MAPNAVVTFLTNVTFDILFLGSGEVRSFQDIRDATSARQGSFITLSSIGKLFGWTDMSLLGVPCEYMQLHTCLRLWSICALSVEVVKCKIPSWYLSACSLTRNGHSYPFFKGDIVSDYSLNFKPTYQAFQGRSKEPICTWTPFRSHQVSSIILFSLSV